MREYEGVMEEFKYRGRFIQVSEEIIEQAVWERAYIPSGVIIYPFISDKKILMIKERRPHEKEPVRLKFVSGHIETNEDPLLTANRELQEEIGKKAQQLELIRHHHTSGTINNELFLIKASSLIDSKLPNPDGEDTIEEVVEIELNEVFNAIHNGDISLGFGVLGFLLLYHKEKSST